jgi:hypothetical protein
MRQVAVAIGVVAIAAVSAAQPAHAQTFDRPVQTQTDLQTLAADIGPTMRFRQLGDTETVRRGDVEVGMQYGNDMPGVVARFGLAERTDLGAWGAVTRDGHSGIVGADTKVALLREGPSMPVSMAIRPSVSALVGAANAWTATAGIDLSISRRFGPLSPYGGLAASATAAYAKSRALRLDWATSGDTYAYAGVSFRWHALVVSGEAENGREVTYALKIGTRF